MDEKTIARARDLLHEVAELHHAYYRVTDGADDDWASFYATWLVQHSELPALLGTTPVRSYVVHELVALEREYRAEPRRDSWEDYYAARLVERLSAAGRE